jgi:hypothetical protein
MTVIPTGAKRSGGTCSCSSLGPVRRYIPSGPQFAQKCLQARDDRYLARRSCPWGYDEGMNQMNPKKPSEGFETRDAEYSAQISKTGLSVLQSMIGNRFYSIHAPCLQVAGSHLTAPSFSIPVFDRITGNWSRQYIVIQCDWSETPLTLTDYWRMLVSCDDKPDRIGVDSTGAIIAPCTIKYFRATPICKIDVYEFECSPEFDQGRETVKYDKGIRFETESGKAFCIACQVNGPGILTEVSISEDDATISQFLEGSRLRVRLTSNGL